MCVADADDAHAAILTQGSAHGAPQVLREGGRFSGARTGLLTSTPTSGYGSRNHCSFCGGSGSGIQCVTLSAVMPNALSSRLNIQPSFRVQSPSVTCCPSVTSAMQSLSGRRSLTFIHIILYAVVNPTAMARR